MVSGVAAFFIIVAILAVLLVIAWVVYSQFRARRLGLPPPAIASYNPFSGGSSASRGYGEPRPASGGIFGWVNGKFRSIRNSNNRSGTGAYKEPLTSNVRGRASNRGFGPLDPDEAWDTQVGTEADSYGPAGYYEGHEPDNGQTPGAPSVTVGRNDYFQQPEPFIGGSQAGLDSRYNEEMGKKPVMNPFDDPAADSGHASLQGVSPLPELDSSSLNTRQQDLNDNTSERRSISERMSRQIYP